MGLLSGFKKFKKYVKQDNGYILQSEWTSSTTVEMSSGKTLDDALGNYSIKVVDSLPSIQDENTLYFVKKAGG